MKKGTSGLWEYLLVLVSKTTMRMMTSTERSACLPEKQILAYIDSILFGCENKMQVREIGEEYNYQKKHDYLEQVLLSSSERYYDD